MGIIKNGVLTGAVGPTVSYMLKGQQVVRTKPKKFKQTAATKASAQDFGNIKRLSRALRSGLAGVYPPSQLPSFMYVMDAAARRWYYEYYLRRDVAKLDPAYFSGLQITPGNTPFVKTLLGVEPEVDWSQENKVVLQIPAIKRESLIKPSSVKALSFKLVVSGGPVTPMGKINPKFRYYADEYSEASEVFKIDFGPEGSEAVTITIDDFKLPGNSFVLAYLAVGYRQGVNSWVKEEKWNPVVVVGSNFKA